MSTDPIPFNVPPHTTPEGCVQQPMTKRQAADILALQPGGPSHDADCLDWSNYGAALYLARRDKDALFAVQRAVAIQRNSTTLINLGIVLEGFGKFESSQRCFKEAHELDPHSLMAGSGYADGLLRLGNWKEGWPLYALYHSRLLIEHIPTLSELANRRVIVIKNGKYGDNIYHFRWFKALREAGCHITYVCDPLLRPLLQGHPWLDNLVTAPRNEGVLQWYTDGAPTHTADDGTLHFNLREFDFILSIMALPAVVQAEHATAWPGQYLKGKSSRLRRALSLHTRVGFCWKAGEEGFPRAHRSLSAVQCSAVVNAGWHMNWISLVPDLHVHNTQSSKLRDWRDTASVIDSCDIVVTVDTGVAHLAAAMGKPTFVILSGGSAWQYGIGDDYKKVYPTMTVFRNRGVGLDNSVEELATALENI